MLNYLQLFALLLEVVHHRCCQLHHVFTLFEVVLHHASLVTEVVFQVVVFQVALHHASLVTEMVVVLQVVELHHASMEEVLHHASLG